MAGGQCHVRASLVPVATLRLGVRFGKLNLYKHGGHGDGVGNAAELGDDIWLLCVHAERDRNCAEFREMQTEGRQSRCSQERSLGVNVLL